MDLLKLLKDNALEGCYDHKLLSEDYEQTILKGTQLSSKHKVRVETHLIKTRSFEKAEKVRCDSSKERKDFLCFLIDELNKHNKSADEVLVFISRYIASNIHILKNQLKHTYNEIPWEEMEFCLVVFIADKMGRDWTFISHLLLDRETILCYLNDFCNVLRTQNSKPYKPKTTPTNRVFIKNSVLSTHPEFKKLYDDYETLKDIYSLRRMQLYLNVALSSTEDQMKPHAIERTLQVIGEHLKNTRDSPNISLETKKHLLNSAPKYLKENLTSLRDILSHLNFLNASELPNISPIPDSIWNQALKKILSILRNMFFAKREQEDIINDLKRVYVGIATVLFEKLVQVYKKKRTEILLKDDIVAKHCEKFSEIVNESRLNSLAYVPIFNKFDKMTYKQIAAVYNFRNELTGLNYKSDICDFNDFKDACDNNVLRWIFETCTTFQNFVNNSEEQKIITIGDYDIFSFSVKEVRSISGYKEQLESDRDEESAKQKVDKICLKIEDALKGVKEKKRFYKKLKSLEALHHAKEKILRDETIPNNEYQALIQEFPSKVAKTLEKLNPDDDLEVIKNTVKRTYDAYGILTKDVATQGIVCVKNYRSLLCKFCETLNLKNHSGVVDKLVTDFKKEIEKYFKDTLSQLIEITSTKIIYNNDLRMISIEMLLLDLLEILMSTYNFTDNTLFLDRTAPLLLGKNLRNYLAHGNPLIETFPFDPRNSMEIHCTLFIEKSLVFEEEVNYGQTTSFALENAKEIYHKRLVTVKNQTAMFEAAKRGNIRKVEECVRTGADPAAFDVNGESGLKYGAKANNVELLMYFLDQNVGENVESLLESAAENGCGSIVEYLLENNQQAKNCLQRDNKLLHLAVLNNERSMVRLLLISGCKANAMVSGRTPLYLAALKGFDAIADILINHGALVSLKDNLGEQALHAAAKSGSWKCAEMFLNKAADVEARNSIGYTALHFAAMFGRAEFIEKLLASDVRYRRIESALRNSALFLATLHGHERCVEVLLKHRGQPQMKIKTNKKKLQTPLHVATYFGYRSIVKQLLESGASVRDKDSNFCTALHFAAFRGWTDLIKPLFHPGLKTDTSATALHLAAYSGNGETVRAVLECEKSVIDSVDKFGRTALHVAAFHGNCEAVKVLIKAGANTNILSKKRNTAFLVAIEAGHFQVVNIFLQLCKILQHELNCGLFLAIVCKHEPGVKMLLNAGADRDFEVHLESTAVEISVRPINERAITIKKGDVVFKKEEVDADELPVISSNCLVAAVQTGNVNTVKLLLINGANVNALLTYHEFDRKTIAHTYHNFLVAQAVTSKNPFNLYKCHCLHIASVYGYTDIIELLLKQYGVDKNMKDSMKFTPLWHAVNNDKENAVKLLLKAGADPNLTDLPVETPLQRALHLGHARIAQILLYHDATNIHQNREDEGTHSILKSAVLSGQTTIIEMLLHYDFTFSERYKAFQIAIEYEKAEAVEFLLSVHNFDVNVKLDKERFAPLHLAAMHNEKADITEMLLKRGADANMVAEHGVTPLVIGIAYDNEKIVQLLLKYGADARKAVNDLYGRAEHVSPIHFAVNTTDSSTVLALLIENINEKYADVQTYVNAKDSNGDTPLIWAINVERSIKKTKLLTSFGADVNLQNNNGMSPLHFAVYVEDIELVQFLIENGADMRLKNKDGKTAAEMALETCEDDEDMKVIFDYLKSLA